MEGRHDHLVYEIDDTDSYWGQLAIRQADRVLVVVRPRPPDAAERACMEAVSRRLEALPDVPVWYVVVEEASTTIPSASAELRRRHRPADLVHVRRNRASRRREGWPGW